MPTAPSTPSQGVRNAIELMTSLLKSPDDLSRRYLLRLRSATESETLQRFALL
jgi:hypothetical protein